MHKVKLDIPAIARIEAEKYRAFEQWFATPAGQALLARQRQVLQARIAPLYGARQLELVISHQLALATTNVCTQSILTQVGPVTGGPDGVCVSLPEELPFGHDSLDLVILSHTLDLSVAPHQALREASRVLRGAGRLVVVGFNPFSLWGLFRWFHSRNKAPWSAGFMSWFRVEDWLRLLDFEIESLESHFFRPPVQSHSLLARLDFMDRMGGSRVFPLGCFYVAVAEKRVAARVSFKPVWRPQRVTGLSLVSRQVID